MDLKELIEDFFQIIQSKNIQIYNEISLQHQLGIYLRSILPNYKVQFERNVSFFIQDHITTKNNIDIAIYSNNRREKYAIELRYPIDGQYPEQMYGFVKDVKFLEELREYGFYKNASVVLVANKAFYRGKLNTGIYKYFREEHAIYGKISKSAGLKKNKETISLKGRYEFQWKDLNHSAKFYIIEL